MTVKDVERGTSGPPRSGLRSLTAVRAEATGVNTDSKGAHLYIVLSMAEGIVEAYTKRRLPADFSNSPPTPRGENSRLSGFCEVSLWLETGQSMGLIFKARNDV